MGNRFETEKHEVPQLTKQEIKSNMNTKCEVCHRVLKTKESIERGMGPICASKSGVKGGSDKVNKREFSDITLSDDIGNGIIVRRNAAGVVETNVPHLHVDHSPDGFEYGYGGSGPADLALNIVAVVLNRMGYKGPRSEAWDGSMCFDIAWKLYQDFKWAFIARNPVNFPSIFITLEVAESWILEHCGLPLTHPFMRAHLVNEIWQPNTDNLYPEH